MWDISDTFKIAFDNNGVVTLILKWCNGIHKIKKIKKASTMSDLFSLLLFRKIIVVLLVDGWILETM